ncbi:MAG: phosphate signaling complex PhoU family protein [Pseudonocardiaceae bacterium]
MLRQADLALAALVIAERDRIMASNDAMERRCVSLLALQAPVAGDLRVVVAALHALDHAQRMGNLARHVAVVARLKHPNPMTSGKVRPVLARMSLLASQLAADAALVGRYYERFGDHAVAIARGVCYRVTGEISEVNETRMVSRLR